MFSSEGTTVFATNLPVCTTELDDQDAAYLMYGRNKCPDNARVPAQAVPYGVQKVPFQRPGWRCGAQDRNDTAPVFVPVKGRTSNKIIISSPITLSPSSQTWVKATTARSETIIIYPKDQLFKNNTCASCNVVAKIVSIQRGPEFDDFGYNILPFHLYNIITLL